MRLVCLELHLRLELRLLLGMLLHGICLCLGMRLGQQGLLLWCTGGERQGTSGGRGPGHI